jgi:hypothetical protein
MEPVARSASPAQPTIPTSRWQRVGPIVALLMLAPVIAEVLPGFTRVSMIFVVIPEVMTWGCGALLIRECTRRWRKRWPAMLLLGLALAVAEEWVIQQTSIAPLTGLARQAYGRFWGVNWVYFLWALGYESVWVALVPVQLTELLFPDRRRSCWLKTRGLVIACFVFVWGAFMAWYGWTQRARVKIFHMPPYSPPPLYILSAIVAVVLLILLAHRLPYSQSLEKQANVRRAPSAEIVGLTITILGSPWVAFVALAFGWVPGAPVPFVLIGGLTWCVLTLFLMRRWTLSRDWSDDHRFALVFGGVLAGVVGGFAVFKTGGALRIDWIGKAVTDAAAIFGLFLVRAGVKSRNSGASALKL